MPHLHLEIYLLWFQNVTSNLIAQYKWDIKSGLQKEQYLEAIDKIIIQSNLICHLPLQFSSFILPVSFVIACCWCFYWEATWRGAGAYYWRCAGGLFNKQAAERRVHGEWWIHLVPIPTPGLDTVG